MLETQIYLFKLRDKRPICMRHVERILKIISKLHPQLSSCDPLLGVGLNEYYLFIIILRSLP